MADKRKPKRVSWQPEGASAQEASTGAEPRLGRESETAGLSDSSGSNRSAHENDERLKADKPPHWG